MVEDYKIEFLNRTLAHIGRVEKYGKMLNKNYSSHDMDKLSDALFNKYSLISKKNLTPEESDILNKTTMKHITSNEHHPEYWLEDKSILDNFDRRNPPKELDCTRMTNKALMEMCCDWCAMSEEFNNTPWEWMEDHITDISFDHEYTKDFRWLFNKDQLQFINDVIEHLWGDNGD